jgi:hypothetical protein
MNTLTNNSKREYNSPDIEYIKLDNEISLALESTPAPGPGEPGYIGCGTSEHFNNNPYHAIKA